MAISKPEGTLSQRIFLQAADQILTGENEYSCHAIEWCDVMEEQTKEYAWAFLDKYAQELESRGISAGGNWRSPSHDREHYTKNISNYREERLNILLELAEIPNWI